MFKLISTLFIFKFSNKLQALHFYYFSIGRIQGGKSFILVKGKNFKNC